MYLNLKILENRQQHGLVNERGHTQLDVGPRKHLAAATGKWFLCSWGHVTIIFRRNFFCSGLFKECQKWKERIKNTKMAKFEASGIKE